MGRAHLAPRGCGHVAGQGDIEEVNQAALNPHLPDAGIVPLHAVVPLDNMFRHSVTGRWNPPGAKHAASKLYLGGIRDIE